jgi:hypothetical protein
MENFVSLAFRCFEFIQFYGNYTARNIVTIYFLDGNEAKFHVSFTKLFQTRDTGTLNTIHSKAGIFGKKV